MELLTTAGGHKIACDAIVPGRAAPYLHIHTAALSFAESAAIFSDPAETAVLTVEKDETETEYRGYTVLYSVQVSPFIAGDILIWLNRGEATI